MKTSTSITLLAGLLLPTLASAATDTDLVKAGFDHALNHTPVTGTHIIKHHEVDPLVEAISVALYGQTDTVVASFERDLNRTPVEGTAAVARFEADPLAEAINVALYGKPNLIIA